MGFYERADSEMKRHSPRPVDVPATTAVLVARALIDNLDPCCQLDLARVDLKNVELRGPLSRLSLRSA